MKTLRFYVLTIVFFFMQTVFGNTSETAAVQLAQLLNQFTTFQAEFTQQSFDKNNQSQQASTGTVQMMRPGRFLWKTTSPSHQWVITNGKTLWIYDQDLQQVTLQPVDRSPMSPAKLLSGHADQLLKQFHVSRRILKNNVIIFQLIPHKTSTNEAFQSISMVFAGNQIRRIEMQTNLAQTSVFSFSRVLMNKPLSLSLFNFKVPSGVEVLK